MSRFVVFDCDGTLVDGQAAICETMELAFANAGLVAPERNKVRRIVVVADDAVHHFVFIRVQVRVAGEHVGVVVQFHLVVTQPQMPLEQAVEIEGREVAEKVRDLSLHIYTEARAYARERGIIIADTKFEFGKIDGELILIDEVLTPDSSRFWPLDEYEPGRGQHAYDKQYVRDYLETLDWDKTPPGPELPNEIVERTQARYLDAYEQLTGVVL